MDVLFRTVLIKFNEDVSEDSRKKIYDMMQTLDKDCGGREAGVLFWKVDHNFNPKKCDLVEVAIFENDDALQRFRGHPKHKKFTNVLSEIADWWVGDICVDLPNECIKLI